MNENEKSPLKKETIVSPNNGTTQDNTVVEKVADCDQSINDYDESDEEEKENGANAKTKKVLKKRGRKAEDFTKKVRDATEKIKRLKSAAHDETVEKTLRGKYRN